MGQNDYSFDEMREDLIRSLGLEFNRVCAVLDQSNHKKVEDWSNRLEASQRRDWRGIFASAIGTGLTAAAIPNLAASIAWGGVCALATGLHLRDQFIERKAVADEMMDFVWDRERAIHRIHEERKKQHYYPFGNN